MRTLTRSKYIYSGETTGPADHAKGRSLATSPAVALRATDGLLRYHGRVIYPGYGVKIGMGTPGKLYRVLTGWVYSVGKLEILGFVSEYLILMRFPLLGRLFRRLVRSVRSTV